MAGGGQRGGGEEGEKTNGDHEAPKLITDAKLGERKARVLTEM